MDNNNPVEAILNTSLEYKRAQQRQKAQAALAEIENESVEDKLEAENNFRAKSPTGTVLENPTTPSVIDTAQEFEKSQLFLTQPLRAIPEALVNDMFDTADDIESAITGDEPMRVQFLDTDGRFIKPRLIPKSEADKLTEAGVPDFSRVETDEADTPGKQVVRDVAKFITKFVAFRSAGGGGNAVARDAIAAGEAGFTQDPDQDGLAELLEEIPVVGEIIEPLLNGEEDGPVAKRFKNMFEEAGAGALFDTVAKFAKSGVVKLMGKEANELPLAELSDEQFFGFGDVSEGAPKMGKAKDYNIEAQTDEAFLERGLIEIGGKGKDKTYLNFARIDQPEDIKEVLEAMTKSASGELDKAKRGKMSQEQTEALADSMGMSVSDLLSRRQGEAFNAEQAVAARNLLNASGNKLVELSKVAGDPNASKSDLYLFRRALSMHRAVQAEVVGARAEAGRALQAWSIPSGNKERLTAIEELLGASGGDKVTAKLAQKLSQIDSVGGLAAATRKGAMATTLDAVQESYVVGLLWTPSTHIVNFTGNAISMFADVVNTAVAEGGAKVAGTSGGVTAGETMAKITAMKGSFFDALVHASKTSIGKDSDIGFVNRFKAEAGESAGAISSEAFGISGTQMGGVVDVVGNAVRAPGMALTFNDEFFKAIGYRMQVRQRAHRMVMSEGIDPKSKEFGERLADVINNPPEDIKLSAVDDVLYNTFQQQPGQIGQGIMTLRTGAGPLGTAFFPFARTPVNLFRFSLENSPAAPLVGQWREDFVAGGARRQTAVARMTTGTMLAGFAYDLAQAGYITGGGPSYSEKSQRKAVMRSGINSYSLIMGDQTVSFKRLDPTLATTLSVAADLYDLQTRYDYPDDGEVTGLAQALSVASARALSNKTYLQSFSQIADLVTSEDARRDKVLGSMASAAVPFSTLLSTGERVLDPAVRETMGILDDISARLPLLSKRLIKLRNVWGDEIAPEEGRLAPLAPVTAKTASTDPIEAEILRVRASVLPITWKNVSFDGVKVDFKEFPNVLDEYRKLAGNELKHPVYGKGAKDMLNDIVSGKGDLAFIYDMRSDTPKDGGKALFIEKQIRDFRKLAQREILTNSKYRDSEEFKRFRAMISDQKANKPRIFDLE